jgi:hypothetical protein
VQNWNIILTHTQLLLLIPGIDIAPSMIEYAKKNVPTGDFQVLDCRNIKRLNQKYDGISCGFCIPYLSIEDLITFISDSSHLFQDQVKIYLSFVEGNSTLSGYKTGSTGDRVYFNYHQKELILSTYAKHNIELLKQFDLDYKKGGIVTEVHTVLVLQKKE